MDALLLGEEVKVMDALEEGGNFVVWDDGKDGRVHRGPSVIAVVRLAAGGSAALNLFPKGEAADAHFI
jgi:hypothetical protein